MNLRELHKDEKADKYFQETTDYLRCLEGIIQRYEGEESQLNILFIAKQFGDFYDKNHHKYNENQLVYQSIKTIFKNKKFFMDLYRRWKQIKKQ